MTVRTHGGLIVLPYWETISLAPFSYIILTLSQPVLALSYNVERQFREMTSINFKVFGSGVVGCLNFMSGQYLWSYHNGYIIVTAHSWQLYSVTQLGNKATSTITHIPRGQVILTLS